MMRWLLGKRCPQCLSDEATAHEAAQLQRVGRINDALDRTLDRVERALATAPRRIAASQSRPTGNPLPIVPERREKPRANPRAKGTTHP